MRTEHEPLLSLWFQRIRFPHKNCSNTVIRVANIQLEVHVSEDRSVQEDTNLSALRLEPVPASGALYEINTRTWLRAFGQNATLADVPATYWDKFVELGVDQVWLMGVWKGVPEAVKEFCHTPELVAEYSRSLPGFEEEDVIGSPYAIDRYQLNPMIGSFEDLRDLKKELNHRGIKLVLDFVPNHFNARSSLIEERPELFLRLEDRELSFSTGNNSERFAHGRDPYFAPWRDTVQVDYFEPQAREFMKQTLLDVASLCDGVRCDMAMLVLNRIFEQSWGELTSGSVGEQREFWAEAIDAVREQDPDFIFLAEAYWGTEHELQKLGFDYVYDKTLYDRLRVGDVEGIKAHISASVEFQAGLARFIENHDEERAAQAFGVDKSKAAAVLVATLPGLSLFYDGQFSGHRLRTPVQLGRDPEEDVVPGLEEFYSTLLRIADEPVFKSFDRRLLQAEGVGDDSFQNLIAYQINGADSSQIVVVNYSSEPARANIRGDFSKTIEVIELYERLGDEVFKYKTNDLIQHGLYVELPPYGAHIMSIKREEP